MADDHASFDRIDFFALMLKSTEWAMREFVDCVRQDKEIDPRLLTFFADKFEAIGSTLKEAHDASEELNTKQIGALLAKEFDLAKPPHRKASPRVADKHLDLAVRMLEKMRDGMTYQDAQHEVAEECHVSNGTVANAYKRFVTDSRGAEVTLKAREYFPITPKK